MRTIAPFQGKKPILHPTVFVADGARIIGDVEIGKDSSIWYNAVVRGDVHFVRIGERTNVQDGAILHVTHKKFSLNIGSDVTIGHGAILHGCTIGNKVLVGMGAIVLDGAIVEDQSMIAAGSLVLEGTVVPKAALVAGVPAKVKRLLTDEEKKTLEQSAQNYVNYVSSYRSQ